jgi:hypothetical protein
VWLIGTDGNEVTTDDDVRVTQARMLARRRDRVGIPGADRAPWDVSNPYADDAEER